jgi:hypothetical protein
MAVVADGSSVVEYFDQTREILVIRNNTSYSKNGYIFFGEIDDRE